MLRVLMVLVCAPAVYAAEWRLASSPHFEVYAQAGGQDPRAVLLWFEQLQSFFERETGLRGDARPPLRIVVFASPQEYEPYRIGPSADAFYVGAEARDYIAMAHRGGDDLRIAAHEYWHFLEHATGLRFPAWLNEGLAEFFSTVRPGVAASYIGGDLAARSRALRTRPWIPMRELLSIPGESLRLADRATSDSFYAQSWALVDMLLLGRGYAPRFPGLLHALAAGTDGSYDLAGVFGRPIDSIERDLRQRVTMREFAPVALPPFPAGASAMEASDVSSLSARALMAELLLATSRFDRSETLYRGLAADAPGNPDFPAALATIALRKDHPAEARHLWARALEAGISDPDICYRYALLAEDAGFAAGDVRAALERAVELRPRFDDALYHLALVENNAGDSSNALRHLRSIQSVKPAREYQYWITTASALTELGRREEAKAAADRAVEIAATSEERINAMHLGILALTDLAVQFVRDPRGNLQLVTTRKLHNAPEWNPFIEPGDRIRRVEGRLREIDCSGPETLFLLETSTGPVTVFVPDPLHVQMRNAPPEFTCGTQRPVPVTAVYAASGNGSAGVLRGLNFSTPSSESPSPNSPTP
ncbi:MAG: hypothetical protein C5B51_23375 [Terriglobia bacterium]|nr:MAG: hypothetical protein C5B51_23375 [Terriglobia bacterium]